MSRLVVSSGIKVSNITVLKIWYPSTQSPGLEQVLAQYLIREIKVRPVSTGSKGNTITVDTNVSSINDDDVTTVQKCH